MHRWIEMITKSDVFGYYMSGQQGWEQGCPKCHKDSLINLNFNDKIACINPKCDWEWNRYDNKNK